MFLNPTQKELVHLAGECDGMIADSAVRHSFPRPPRMAIDLMNLSGRDIDADGGWQRALAETGLRGEYDFKQAAWVILPLTPEEPTP